MAGAGNLALMLDFRWARGKNIAGKVVNFSRGGERLGGEK